MNTEIVIHGTQLSVPETVATRTETIQIGSRVKVLQKEYYGFKVSHGIVIGFEPFKLLPTIVIAVAKMSYNELEISFVYYNSEIKDVEVVIASADDQASLDKERVVEMINNKIAAKQAEIVELENKKNYFLNKFATYWTPVTTVAE